DSLPLTPNGKVDKKALPVADGTLQLIGQYVAPRNEAEEQLAAIWQELLGIEKISIHDNFFELGGDSILTIQLVSRAGKAGLTLQPKDIFIHQTIAGIAEALADQAAAVVYGDQGYLEGVCGLLPIQQWYFDHQQVNLSHFNQSVLLTIDKAISEVTLQAAVTQLMRHHDALRFRYSYEQGQWQQTYGDGGAELQTEDLQDVAGDLLGSAIDERANHYQRSLDIEKGELVRVVWIKMPASAPANRLLIIIHHLVVDGVSWRILLEDLEELLTSLSHGVPAILQGKSSS
ncbi:condensation domain-containing protein, partial [Danxiaibacter flavus]